MRCAAEGGRAQGGGGGGGGGSSDSGLTAALPAQTGQALNVQHEPQHLQVRRAFARTFLPCGRRASLPLPPMGPACAGVPREGSHARQARGQHNLPGCHGPQPIPSARLQLRRCLRRVKLSEVLAEGEDEPLVLLAGGHAAPGSSCSAWLAAWRAPPSGQLAACVCVPQAWVGKRLKQPASTHSPLQCRRCPRLCRVAEHGGAAV